MKTLEDRWAVIVGRELRTSWNDGLEVDDGVDERCAIEHLPRHFDCREKNLAHCCRSLWKARETLSAVVRTTLSVMAGTTTKRRELSRAPIICGRTASVIATSL